jgi:hypothetical protein
MTSKYERYKQNETAFINDLKVKEKEFISLASDKEFAIEEFFEKIDTEFRLLQKAIPFNQDFFLEIERNIKLKKNFDESLEYERLSDSDILNYSRIKAFQKYHSELQAKLKQEFTEFQPLIKWNEKKSTKIVYANFLKLAYGIIYSNEYFSVDHDKRDEAVEQLAQFFSIKMGKGWQSTLNNEIEINDKKNIFKVLEESYLKNKKPKRKRTNTKQ